MSRDWYRYYNDGGGSNLKDALWNTGETALDVIGGKLVSKGLKRVNDKAFVKELNGRIQDEIKKREGHILSGIQNGHNVIAALPNDATRVNRPIYIPQPIQLR